MEDYKLKDIELELGQCKYKGLKYKPDFIYYDFIKNIPNSIQWHFELSALYSKNTAKMISWISPGDLYMSDFNFNKAPGWGAPSKIILSGYGKLSAIGLLYSKIRIKNGWKAITDQRPATESSLTIKWIVDSLLSPQSRVLDPVANENAFLATWCRRYCISYLGFFSDKEKLSKAQKVINQIELPFKQEEIEYAQI